MAAQSSSGSVAAVRLLAGVASGQDFAAHVCMWLDNNGKAFSIENAWNSILWKTPAMENVLNPE